MKTLEDGAAEDDNHNEEAYDWHDRCKVLDIKSIIQKTKNAMKEEKSKLRKNIDDKKPDENKLKNQFIEYYRNNRRSFRSDLKLFEEWKKSMMQLYGKSIWIPQISKLKKWITRYKYPSEKMRIMVSILPNWAKIVSTLYYPWVFWVKRIFLSIF